MKTDQATRLLAFALTAVLTACGGDSKPPATDVASATLVPDPAWTCGMGDGIPPPTQGTLVLTATLQLGDTQDVGVTQYGHRRVLDVTGGTFTGSAVHGTVVTGGFDFELTLSNGVVEQEQVGVLRASDNTNIYLRTCGVAPAGASVVRIVPDFEVATASPLAWLNTGKFAGTRTIDAAAGTMVLAIYDVSAVSTASNRIQIAKPEGVESQPWDCGTATGTIGDRVYSEHVTLGTNIAIGTSKRGNRNALPLTGGTLAGNILGTIVPGGADYQLIPPGGTDADNILDARYVLKTQDGEYIVVRNCGLWNTLAPRFEARAASSYAYLNADAYRSSPPGVGSGSVDITIYHRN
jgi:hypothetical protein